MIQDRVSSPVAPVAPLPPVAQPVINLAGPAASADFAKMVDAEIQAASARSGLPSTPSLEKLMAPYAMANAPVVAAPQAGTPPTAPAPHTVVDTSAAVYPAAAPVGPQASAPSAPTAPVSAPTAPVAAAPAAPAPAAEAPAAPAGSYTVQAGDSLSKIARHLGGSAAHWHRLYALNHQTVGGNPDVIVPGQVLTLPKAWQTHTAATRPAMKLEVSVAPAVAPNPSPKVEAPVAASPVEKPVAAFAEAPEATAPAVDDALTMAVAPPAAPSDAHGAEEAIERISVSAPRPGSLTGAPPEAAEVYQNNLAAMRDALKLVPTDSADYQHFKASVDAYDAALSAAGRPAAAQSSMASPAPVGTGVAAQVSDAAPAGFNPPRGTAPNLPAPAVVASAPPVTPVQAAAEPQAAANNTLPTAPATGGASAEPAEDMDAPPVGFY